MNFLLIVFATLIILTLNAEAHKYGTAPVNRKLDYAPLALTKKSNSHWIELAIPHRYAKRTSIAVYYYIKENENNPTEDEDNPTEEFLTACPAHTEHQVKKQNEWRVANKFVESQPRLFFLEAYSGEKMLCKKSAVPGVQKADREYDDKDVDFCGRQNAETHEVGFWVSMDEEAKDIQFVAIYEICYSTARAAIRPYEGTLYTIHRIDSPSLMMLELKEDYIADPLNSFRSYLDNDLDTIDRFYQNYYGHIIVGTYDMPTKVWELTTLFPFNYIPIPKQRDLYINMIHIDNYIRLFASKNRTPLQLYSGTHQKYITVKDENVVLKSFWRIIRNDAHQAILIVTQYSEHELENCGNTFICPNNDNQMLRKFQKGGCAYMCSVSEEIFQLLGSPSFNIRGTLSLSFQTKSKTKSLDGGELHGAESGNATANISDFMSDAGFVAALATIDGGFAAMFGEASEGGNGHDGGGGGGNGGDGGDGGA